MANCDEEKGLGANLVTALSVNALNGLVHSIYRAAMDPRVWSEFVTDLSGQMGGMLVCLHAHDATSSSSLGLLAPTADPDFLGSYENYYVRLNVWAQGVASAPIGKVVHTEEIIDRRDLIKTEFFNDYLNTQELIAATGSVLHRSRDRLLILSGNMRPSEVDSIRTSFSTILDLLGPHISRSFDLMRCLPCAVDGHDYRSVSELSDDPMFFLGANGRVLHGNRAANTMISEATTLSVDCSGNLSFRDRQANNALQGALATIAGVDALRGTREFAVRSASGTLAKAMIVTIQREEAYSLFDPVFGVPAAMLILKPQTQESEVAVAFRRYGLTPAEFDVAKAIARGMSPRAYAESRDISVHTVRAQLKTVFSKTETSRQSQLAVLMTAR